MATKRTNPRRDFTQVALDVARIATGEAPAPKLGAKQESGRIGGLVGGVARASKLTEEQRADIARVAARARWKKTP